MTWLQGGFDKERDIASCGHEHVKQKEMLWQISNDNYLTSECPIKLFNKGHC